MIQNVRWKSYRYRPCESGERLVHVLFPGSYCQTSLVRLLPSRYPPNIINFPSIAHAEWRYLGGGTLSPFLSSSEYSTLDQLSSPVFAMMACVWRSGGWPQMSFTISFCYVCLPQDHVSLYISLLAAGGSPVQLLSE